MTANRYPVYDGTDVAATVSHLNAIRPALDCEMVPRNVERLGIRELDVVALDRLSFPCDGDAPNANWQTGEMEWPVGCHGGGRDPEYHDVETPALRGLHCVWVPECFLGTVKQQVHWLAPRHVPHRRPPQCNIAYALLRRLTEASASAQKFRQEDARPGRGAGACSGVRLDSRQPSSIEVPMRLIGLAVVPCPLGCCRVQNPASGTMRRRELIAIAGTGLVAWPLVARAQQQPRIARLGYLGFGSPANAATVIRVEALRGGLRDFGYVEGKNLVIEFRWSDTVEQLHEAAAELVG